MKTLVFTCWFVITASALGALGEGGESDFVPPHAPSPCAIRLTAADQIKIFIGRLWAGVTYQQVPVRALKLLVKSKTIGKADQRFNQSVQPEVDEGNAREWERSAERRLRRWYSLILREGNWRQVHQLIALREQPMLHNRPPEITDDVYGSQARYEDYPIAFPYEESDAWRFALEAVSRLHEQYIDAAIDAILRRAERTDRYYAYLIEHDSIRNLLRGDRDFRGLYEYILSTAGRRLESLQDAGWW